MAQRPGRQAVAELIDALSASSYEIPGFPEDSGCESFLPTIDVRFTRDGVPLDVLLGYSCYEISIRRAGYWVQSGDFGTRAEPDAFEDERFVKFARDLFPDDHEILKLKLRRTPAAVTSSIRFAW